VLSGCSSSPTATAIGTVASVTKLTIAPATSFSQGVPFGGYLMYPRVMVNGRTCVVEPTLAVSGFELAAGSVVQVLELFEARRPGTYQQTGVIVTYREGSSNKTQLLRSTIGGAVRSDAKPPPIAAADRRCMSHARALND
jgi:hypothetical protein